MSTPESSTAQEGKRHRRAHRKSRYGCLECKQRKIKCDETRPICLNCIRRDVTCSSPSAPVNHPDPASANSRHASGNSLPSRGHYRRGLRFVQSAYTRSSGSPEDYLEAASSPLELRPNPPGQAISDLRNLCGQFGSPRGPPRMVNPNGPSPVLSYADLELWHHYVLLTTGTISGPQESDFWKVQLPEWGFQHPHILHLLLGLAALHKSRACPTQRTKFLKQADSHHVVGMRGATTMLAAIDEKNFAPAYASAIVISLFSLGLRPRQGEYIGFSNNMNGGFLVFLRGVRCIKELQPLKHSNVVGAQDDKRPHGPTKPANESIPYHGHIRYLRSITTAMTDPCDANSADVYLEALESLEPFLSAAFGKDKLGVASASDPYSNIPFAWLYRQSEPFLYRLQRKVPLALAIFACWAVALRELEHSWITKGWPEHIVSSVWESLDIDHKELVSWPMSCMNQLHIQVDLPLIVNPA